MGGQARAVDERGVPFRVGMSAVDESIQRRFLQHGRAVGQKRPNDAWLGARGYHFCNDAADARAVRDAEGEPGPGWGGEQG